MLSLTGKSVWFSLAQRSLLSILDSVFKHCGAPILDEKAFPSINDIEELRHLSELLPLACVDLRSECSSIIIATNASNLAGAVVCTTASASAAKDLYAAFIQDVPKGNSPPDVTTPTGQAYITKLHHLIASSKWTTAFVHKWKRKEHIFCLEASILASSIQ